MTLTIGSKCKVKNYALKTVIDTTVKNIYIDLSCEIGHPICIEFTDMIHQGRNTFFFNCQGFDENRVL